MKESLQMKGYRYKSKPNQNNIRKQNSNVIPSRENSRSYILNHKTIINAAREEVKDDRKEVRDIEKDIIFHRERLIKKKREKED